MEAYPAGDAAGGGDAAGDAGGDRGRGGSCKRECGSGQLAGSHEESHADDRALGIRGHQKRSERERGVCVRRLQDRGRGAGSDGGRHHVFEFSLCDRRERALREPEERNAAGIRRSAEDRPGDGERAGRRDALAPVRAEGRGVRGQQPLERIGRADDGDAGQHGRAGRGSVSGACAEQ